MRNDDEVATPASRVTLADVAARADVSVPTVSKVLRGATDVSAGTRDRVLGIADGLGYVRTPRGRPAVDAESGAPQLVDLVLGVVEGSWSNGVLTGVEEAATAADRDVVITIPRAGRDWVSRLLRRPSSGAIVVLVDSTTAELQALRTAGIPVVLIDPMSPAPPEVASVGVTNWEGGRQAAEHLLDLGHVRFALIGGERRALYSRARLDGFRSALAARDLDVDESLVGAGGWERDAAREVAAGFLDRLDRPTAVFAASDMMALGVCDAARQLGLDVPRDLSVVGFDDIPEAAWASPPLTTVRQPIQEMGASALRMLLRLQDRPTDAGSTTSGPRVDLSTRLVERASTGRVLGT